jgi:hypothetical protein
MRLRDERCLTGLSQADSEKRVNEVATDAKAAADKARKAAAQLSFWLTASLLLGAFAARWHLEWSRTYPTRDLEEEVMGRGILLWLLGVPIPIIILLALFFR